MATAATFKWTKRKGGDGKSFVVTLSPATMKYLEQIHIEAVSLFVAKWVKDFKNLTGKDLHFAPEQELALTNRLHKHVLLANRTDIAGYKLLRRFEDGFMSAHTQLDEEELEHLNDIFEKFELFLDTTQDK
jgi:thermostable 8-oxoguanine DNA glycosylase